MIPEIRRAFAGKPSAWWIETLEKAGVPCGPINRIDDVFADPHVQYREMRRELAHDQLGHVAVTANPVRMTGHDTTAPKAPPTLGADTRAVLSNVLEVEDGDIESSRKQASSKCVRL